MKALIIGSGGREHAILWALKRTASEPLELFCAPGNGGITQLAECVPISATDHKSLIEFARENSIDLTIVGPEAPLAEGIVDDLDTMRGILESDDWKRLHERLTDFVSNYEQKVVRVTGDFQF